MYGLCKVAMLTKGAGMDRGWPECLEAENVRMSIYLANQPFRV